LSNSTPEIKGHALLEKLAVTNRSAAAAQAHGMQEGMCGRHRDIMHHPCMAHVVASEVNRAAEATTGSDIALV